MPCPENQIPIVWAHANDSPWRQAESDHSEFGRSTAHCIRLWSLLLKTHQNLILFLTYFSLGKKCDFQLTDPKLICFPAVSVKNKSHLTLIFCSLEVCLVIYMIVNDKHDEKSFLCLNIFLCMSSFLKYFSLWRSTCLSAPSNTNIFHKT